MHQPLLLQRKQIKSPFSSLQATFNRHCRKINQLHQRLENLKTEYDQALALHFSTIQPKIKLAGDLITKFLLKVMELSQEPNAFNKKDKHLLKDFYKEELDSLLCFIPMNELNDEIKNIYNEVFGKSCDEQLKTDFSLIKEMLKEQGMEDIDLTDINPDDSLEEQIRKLRSAWENKMDKEEEDVAQPQPKEKSKKETLKEQKTRELELLKNKNLNKIYKRLAKVLHPDLEQDLEKRAEKTVLMSKLTVAYKNNDLISLLALESEWLEEVDHTSNTVNEESFKIYNSLLQDQITELKTELSMIQYHPRYIKMHTYIEGCWEKPLKGLQIASSECDSVLNQYTLRLNDLSGKNPLKSLKKFLTISRNESIDEDLFDLLFSSAFNFDFDEPAKTSKRKSRK